MSAQSWNRFNRVCERCMPLVTPCGVVIGFLLGGVAARAEQFGTLFFAFMTFTSSLAVDTGSLARVFRRPLALAVFFVSFHIVQPLCVKLITLAAFPHDTALASGMVLLFSIPAAVSSSIWTAVYGGNTALTIAIVVFDTLLAPFLTPATISLLVGSRVVLDAAGMVQSLLWMVVIPSAAGICVNQFSRGAIPERILPVCRPLSKFALLLVIVVNAGAMRASITRFDSVYITAGIAVVCCSFLGFAVGRVCARIFRLPYDEAVSLTFNCGLRNISAALVLAISFFEPRSGVPVIIGILFQQTLAGVCSRLLLKRQKTPPEAPAGEKS